MGMTLGLYKGFGVLIPYFISDLGSTAMGAGASTSVFGGMFFVLGKYTAIQIFVYNHSVCLLLQLLK